MIRHLLTTTTALALVLSLSAPAAVPPAFAGASGMRLAQAKQVGKPDDAEQTDEAAKKQEDEEEKTGAASPGRSGDAPCEAKSLEGTEASAEADTAAETDAAAEGDARVSEDCVSEDKAERGAEEAAAAGEAEADAEERVSGEEPEAERGADEAAAAEEAATDTAAETDADARVSEEEEEVGTAAEEKAAAEEGGTAEGSAEAEGEAEVRATGEETEPEKQAIEASETTEEAEPPAAAAAESDGSAEAVEVTSETVTEETTRTSDEEVEEATAERRDDGAGDDDTDDTGDILKILGAAGAGLAAGALLSGGGEVVETTGDRVIIQRDGEYFVRTDENQLLRRPGSELRTETFSDGSTRTVAQREDGVRVITIRDVNGYTVRRSKIMPDGREIVLFDDTRQARRDTQIDWTTLPQVDYSVPHREYVDYSGADRQALRDMLQARPVADLDRRFTLRQVRENLKVRQLMPRLDLDTITFDLGSAAIRPEQARELDALGREMEAILDENPDEVFLIEGHTDAVGGRVMNLALSDRRAETVALALTEYYYIPPENLITQGYGEEYLKIETQGPERANRRATVRRITPLLEQLAGR